METNELKTLIKECIIEILKEDLTEAFDPTSQGPNPVQENPYPFVTFASPDNSIPFPISPFFLIFLFL